MNETERKDTRKYVISSLSPCCNVRIQLKDVCVCAHTCAQLCPALCDLMNCNLPGSSVYRIFQAKIMERVAISFSRGSSRSRD